MFLAAALLINAKNLTSRFTLIAKVSMNEM